MTDIPEGENQKQGGGLRRVLLDVGPPSTAHLVNWTRVGSQVLLEIGYFDLVSMNQQIVSQPDADKRILDWYVTNRFVVDLLTAKRIVESMRQLGEAISESETTEGANAASIEQSQPE